MTIRASALEPAHRSLGWVDLMKATAFVWIFLNHASEILFGYPYLANPTPDWPPLAGRAAQLLPLQGSGLWDVPINSLRYIGWTGDQGVQLFIILSGFGLTWGLLSRHQDQRLPLLSFYLRRFGRVYPLWWGAHLVYVAAAVLLGLGFVIFSPSFCLSMLGIRVTPGLLYYLVPAWWYVNLLIQLYLIYPVLWATLRRWGPLRLLVVGSALAFGVRAAGLLTFTGYLDAWQRGAIFITRLPEFLLGMALADWMFRQPQRTDRLLRRPRTILLAAASYGIGLILALTLIGMTLAPFILGAAAFVILYAVLQPIGERVNRLVRGGKWLGGHSYSLYLVHQPIAQLLVPTSLAVGLARAGAGLAAAFVVTLLVGIGLERGVAIVEVWLKRLRGMWGARRVIAVFGALAASLVVVLLGAELLIRRVDPQEALGWGERPSLTIDPVLGWKLRPSQQTHLRWETYDYTVDANELGFPGPAYAEQRAPNSVRILVTGDAFSSAEGVNTDRSWVRRLESDLAARLPDKSVEVMDFAITGYGPNQYAAVVDQYAPRFKPDLIVVELFVNDLQDVLTSNEQFQDSIGFGRPDPNSVMSILTLAHLRRWIDLNLVSPLKARLRSAPEPHGYFLGNIAALERDSGTLEQNGVAQLTERLKQIKRAADAAGAQTVAVIVPASVQVCRPDQLAYFPSGVDLSDRGRFDLERPQRLLSEAAESAGLRWYDLREALRLADGRCLYQPHNMHWLAEGHDRVAAYVAELLSCDLELHSTTR